MIQIEPIRVGSPEKPVRPGILSRTILPAASARFRSRLPERSGDYDSLIIISVGNGDGRELEARKRVSSQARLQETKIEARIDQ